MRIPQTSALRSLLVAGLLFGTTCSAADSKPVVIKQHTAGGNDCFALAVRSILPPQNSISRHVILVDTSASQVGKVRDSSLALVSEVIAGLPAKSVVQIYAVDVEADALTDGFVPTASREVNSALQLLSLRTPLGTTNLKKALHEIANSADASSPTSVLFIGDGLTSSDRISRDELNDIVTDLNARSVSVHSLVLGPQANAELPSILANLTGGNVASVVRGQEKSIAKASASALRIAPIRVHSFSADGKLISHAGNAVTFVRPDRHSVIFGTGRIAEFKTLVGKLDDQATVDWSGMNCERTEAGAEIFQLLSRVESSRGINSAIASLEALNTASQQFRAALKQTIAASDYLERQGRHRESRNLRDKAAVMFGDSTDAKMILTGIQQDQPPVQDPAPPIPAEEAPAAPDPVDESDPLVPVPQANTDAFGGGPVRKDDPLSAVEAEVKLQTQILTAETNSAIAEARDISYENPNYATSLLKDILETIRASADISPDVRTELDRRVVAALAGVSNQREVNVLRGKQIAKEQAVQEAQRKLLAEQRLEESRLAILIDQVRGLLDRARHGDRNGFEDGESVSRTALDLKPGNGPATQSLVMSEALGQLDKAYRLVNLRHDRFLAVLYQVELSHVPFPDEPPIQYPPADVWRALTLTRKPRYESFDLRSEKPVEKWLGQMLDKPVPLLDFPGETPLSEVLEQISTYYTTTWGQDGGASGTDFRMTIWPDKAELELEGINSLEDITVSDISFEGMTLRNALKLIFDQTTEPELTYLIQNEVLMITTLAKAESDENLVTRVYPVADLVIPPIQLGGGGGQQGGGQQGGGQQGGGQFGGGGGQQGGGQFGGGGGAGFSIPPEAVGVMADGKNGGISTNSVKAIKKKPVLN